MTTNQANWIVLRIAGHDLGIATRYVREMFPLAQIHRPPGAPEGVRGLVRLRQQLLPAWDMRRVLGYKTLPEELAEFAAMFEQRKQDHVDWLEELRRSVEERRAFQKTTDPHACAFGRWYDAYKAPDSVLAIQLMKFDAPHKKIHALATTVRKLVDMGEHGRATAMIRDAWNNELATMLGIFDETLPMIRCLSKEIVLLASDGSCSMGLIVDDVTETCDLELMGREQADPWGGSEDSRFFAGFGMRGAQQVALLDFPAFAQAMRSPD